MKIQQYKNQHREKCIEVFDSNVGQYFAATEREEFVDYLDTLKDDCEYFVCIRDGLLLACGGIGINAAIGSLAWGMVHRSCHGKGIGSALTDYRLLYLRSNTAADVVKIETSQHTQGFYKKRGFVVTKTISDGFGEGIDCVAMALSNKSFISLK